ncbi:hypothetical protein AM629_08835 [Photorhabdus heterorhabditis]|uniref:Uncharacterized protein n=1 Tax=Photorhabdus heterorhabditis TaxID=880156 RepID=A0ABR5KCJ7_9GAMM|nr:hypothetical protein [Photorhabdus heterorhabditis]KOY62329.1 hypothetical protein AM629_08835 [Photorhabdus heterorhabditis]
MLSVNMRSAVCDCKIPDPCIHKLVLKVGKRVFNYNQIEPIGDIWVIDETGGIPVTISLVGKRCITENAQCPRAIFYSPDNAAFQFYELGKNPIAGPGTDYKISFSSHNLPVDLVENDPLSFIASSLFQRGDLNHLPRTDYILTLTQCYGQPFAQRSFSLPDDKVKALLLGTVDALDTKIHVLPQYEWTIDITLGAEQEIQERSAEERKAEALEKRKKANPNAKKPGQNWHKHTAGYELTNTLNIEGSFAYTVGPYSRTLTRELKKEFKEKRHKLGLLNKSSQAVETLQKLFSSEGSQEIKLLKTEIQTPEIKLGGGSKLVNATHGNGAYFEHAVEVALSPLIGVKLQVDLIQAFATEFGAEKLIALIREQGLKGKEAVEEGRNGAYLGAQLDMILEGALNLSFKYASNEEREMEFQLGDMVKGTLAIRAETNIQVGFKYYLVEGYFKADADIEAQGCFELDKQDKGLYLVFFHEGITASYYVEFGMGIAPPKSNSDSAKQKDGKDSKTQKKWEIYPKLPKEKSTYKLRLS